MPNYVENIKVGSGESWPVRDAEAHSRLDALGDISALEGALLSTPVAYNDAGTGSDEAAFETWLDARLSEMDEHTVKTIEFYVESAANSGLNSGTCFGLLAKLDDDHAELCGMSHCCQFMYKWKESGAWKPMCSMSEAINKNSMMILSANQHGTALPEAGTPGRLFFKKV